MPVRLESPRGRIILKRPEAREEKYPAPEALPLDEPRLAREPEPSEPTMPSFGMKPIDPFEYLGYTRPVIPPTPPTAIRAPEKPYAIPRQPWPAPIERAAGQVLADAKSRRAERLRKIEETRLLKGLSPLDKGIYRAGRMYREGVDVAGQFTVSRMAAFPILGEPIRRAQRAGIIKAPRGLVQRGGQAFGDPAGMLTTIAAMGPAAIPAILIDVFTFTPGSIKERSAATLKTAGVLAMFCLGEAGAGIAKLKFGTTPVRRGIIEAGRTLGVGTGMYGLAKAEGVSEEEAQLTMIAWMAIPHVYRGRIARRHKKTLAKGIVTPELAKDVREAAFIEVKKRVEPEALQRELKLVQVPLGEKPPEGPIKPAPKVPEVPEAEIPEHLRKPRVEISELTKPEQLLFAQEAELPLAKGLIPMMGEKPTVKQPWEMTQEQYKQHVLKTRHFEPALGSHETYVRDALSKGKLIPGEVLAEYPELAKPAAPEAPPLVEKKLPRVKGRVFCTKYEGEQRQPKNIFQWITYWGGVKPSVRKTLEGKEVYSAPDELGDVIPRFAFRKEGMNPDGLVDAIYEQHRYLYGGIDSADTQAQMRRTAEILADARADPAYARAILSEDGLLKFEDMMAKRFDKDANEYYAREAERLGIKLEPDVTDQVIGKNLAEVMPDIEANAQRGGISLEPRRPKYIHARDPRVEAALTAHRRPTRLLDMLRVKLGGLKKIFDDVFSYEALLKEYPQLKNDFRLFAESPTDARKKATDGLVGVLGSATPREYETFRRLVALHDFVATKGRGLTLPKELKLEDVVAERGRLTGMARDSQPNAIKMLQRHNDLMRAVAQDLVNRGKLSESEVGDAYFPHRVLDYSAKIDEFMPGYPKRARAPFRYYTKRRVGSKRDINTDYLDVMYRHLTKVFLDNAMDDFVTGVANKYDYLLRLPAEERKAFIQERGPLLPRRIYDIGDKRYVGWQYDPGNYVYPALTVNEAIASKAYEQSLTPAEWDALVGKRGGKAFNEAFAIGGKKPVYILPEPIAERLTRFREFQSDFAPTRAVRDATSLWKRITLDFALVPFRVNNFLGDTLNLFREDPAAVLRIPEAAYMLARNEIKLSDFQREVMRLAKEHRVIGGFAAFRGEFMAPERDPRLRHLQPLRHYASKLNLLNIVEEMYSFVEDTPRLAKLMTDFKRIHEGKQAKVKSTDIKGLTPIEAAGKAGREFTIDYAAITPFFRRYMRGILFPFATFWVYNARNWAKYVAKHPVEFGIKFGIPYALMNVWNWSKFPDIEAGLPEWYRYMPHVITGYYTEDEAGRTKPIIIALQTPVEMAVQVAALDKIPDKVARVIRGEMTAKDAVFEQAKDMVIAPGELALQLFTPFIKSFGELLRNKTTFTGMTIVPERMRGTAQGRWRQVQHMLSSLIAPYSQYRRALGILEAEEPALKWFVSGPFDLKRAIGYREIDMERAKSFVIREKAKVLDAISKSKTEGLRSAFIESRILNKPSIYNKEVSRLRALPEPQPDWSIVESPYVLVEITRQKLTIEKNPAKRRELLKELQAHQEAAEMHFIGEAPLPIRAELSRELEKK